jgi:TP901 family phage tail tape measure protein
MAGVSGGSAAAGVIRAGRAAVEFFIDSSQFDRQARKIEQRFRAMGQAAQRIGLGMTAVGIATAPVVRAFTAFDDAIRTAGGAAEASAGEFAYMTRLARELGMTTAFTATEVAKLMTELARGGVSVGDIEAVTRAVLDLSRASGTDAAEAGDIVARAMAGFGLEGKEAARVANALGVAANKSLAGVTDIGYALAYAARTSKDSRLSIEQTLAVLAGLAQVGIKGEMAGTTLRRMEILTGAERQKMKDIFGIDPQDAAGQMRPIVDVMDEIFASLRGLDDATRTDKLEEFFGILGVTGALSIGESARSIRALYQEIMAGDGFNRRMAAFMDQGLSGAFKRFRGAAEGAAIALGTAFAPAMDAVAAKMREWVLLSTEAFGENENMAVGVAGAIGIVAAGLAAVVAGLVAAKVAAIAFGATWTLVTAPILIVKALVLGLLSPIGLVVAAVAGLGYLFATQTESGRAMTDSIKAGFAGLAETAKTAFSGIGDALKAGDLSLAFSVFSTAVSLEWAKLTEFMTKVWNSFKGVIVDGWLEVGTFFAKVFNGIAAAGERIFTYLGNFIPNIWSGIIQRVLEGVLAVLEAIDSLDPTDSVVGGDVLEGYRARIRKEEAARGVPDALIDEIDRREREVAAALDRGLAAEREARRAARDADAAAAKADVDRLAAELARLRAAAAAAAAGVPAAAPPPGGGVPGGGMIFPLATALVGGGLFATRQEAEKRTLAIGEGVLAGALKAPKDELERAVKGAFDTPFANLQFGYGDSAKMREEKIQVDIAAATRATAANTRQMLQLFRVR